MREPEEFSRAVEMKSDLLNVLLKRGGFMGKGERALIHQRLRDEVVERNAWRKVLM